MKKSLKFFAIVLTLLISPFLLGACGVDNNRLMPDENITSITITANSKTVTITDSETITSMFNNYGSLTVSQRPGDIWSIVQPYGETECSISSLTESGTYNFSIVKTDDNEYFFQKRKPKQTVYFVATTNSTTLTYFLSFLPA